MPLSPAVAAALADLLRDGATDTAAADALGINRGTAARYCRTLGLPPAPRRPVNRSPLTLSEAFMECTRPAAGGHREWTGRRTSGGTPTMTHQGIDYTGRRAAWTIAAGRPPTGYVTAECDAPDWCVAPEHMQDEPGRTRLRGQLAAVLGRTSEITECTRGHDIADHRRYDRTGRAYCALCHAIAKQANATDEDSHA